MYDISRERELLDYLLKNGLIEGKNYSVRYFNNGVSATVAMIENDKKSIIAKQALAKLNVAADWACDQSRMLVEQKALTTYSKIIKEYVPAPIFYDEENYIMVREAAPRSSSMWKEQLLKGVLDFSVAEKAAQALSAIHNRTAGDQQVAEEFKEIKFFYDLRIEPYIETVVKVHPQLKEHADRIVDRLMNQKIALVHGDYSPKNILVDQDRLYVLDLEVSHYGNPAFDLAFFTNHFVLKAVKNSRWYNAYLTMLDFIAQSYLKAIEFADAKEFEHEAVQILAYHMLARIDGKSPAEYITDSLDKDIVRAVAFKIIEQDSSCYDDVISELAAVLRKSKKY
ncbi:phosphotransferase [Desulfitobacterium hafniense]|uniref:phosphotransferase n=1 Tax=Desulfitobacterium hafniense TaxID=49338 RepID=UPI00037F8BF4|nr:aminoglycoside phosphotransferase family protein [Desulfitobacterium hafniense]